MPNSHQLAEFLQNDLAELFFVLLTVVGWSAIKPFLDPKGLGHRAKEMIEFTEVGVAWVTIPPAAIVSVILTCEGSWGLTTQLGIVLFFLIYLISLITLVNLKFEGLVTRARYVEWYFRLFSLVSFITKVVVVARHVH